MHKVRREFKCITMKINTKKTIIGEMRDQKKKKLKTVWCRENYLANWQKSLFTSIYFNCKYSSRRHTKVRATPKTIFSEKDLKTSWTALAQQGAEKSYQDELREPEIHSFQHPTPSSEGRGLLELFVGTDTQAGAILHSTYVASSFSWSPILTLLPIYFVNITCSALMCHCALPWTARCGTKTLPTLALQHGLAPLCQTQHAGWPCSAAPEWFSLTSSNLVSSLNPSHCSTVAWLCPTKCTSYV